MHKILGAILTGVLGGVGLSWMLNHLPPGAAMALAVVATVGAATWLWKLQRDMSRTQKELDALIAAIRRMKEPRGPDCN